MIPARDVIRLKRDGEALDEGLVASFVRGITDGSWSDAECGAMAMAMYLRGMDAAETVALTRAMTASGEVLDWSQQGLPGPVLDKHSTGGVGDKVSLVLAPILAACGAYVPMISGRALGHTGGTLDKLDAIPGYATAMHVDRFRALVRSVGCAITGQSAEIAPADGRFYALRNLTATVDNIPLITASILSKKLAAGLQGLAMDVKVGNGAFMKTIEDARALARSIVQVGCGAGMETRALITDMDSALGHTAGNALEVLESVELLRGDRADARLLEVTVALAVEMLEIGRIAQGAEAAARVQAALASGRALEHFARMVHGAGGPADFAEAPRKYLPEAPVQRPVLANAGGWVVAAPAMDMAVAVMDLGGGRRTAHESPDLAVGLSDILPVGRRVEKGDLLATVHARDEAAAEAACGWLRLSFELAEAPPSTPCCVIEKVTG